MGEETPSQRWLITPSMRPEWWLVAAAAVAAVLLLSHLPSLAFHAQFYADDGGWYQAAYAQGPLRSLLHPAAGYVVMLQRLVASASLVLPVVAAPTLFNLVAVAAGVAGICYLLSSRMASAIPSLAARVAIALLVIALPNAYDTTGNLTNAQWRLGLLVFLVIFAAPPRRAVGWVVDTVILVVGGLTGPYCLLLEPIIGWLWLRQRSDRRRAYILAVNTVCVAVQLFVLLTHAGQRTSGALAAGFAPLVQMIARQVTLGLVIGAHGLNSVAGSAVSTSLAVLAVLALIPAVVCLWVAWRGPLVLRAFIVLAGLELALALVAPSIGAPRWPSLGRPASVVDFHPGGIRYFLYPLLAFALSLGWLAVDALRRFARDRWRLTGPVTTRRVAANTVGGGAAIALLAAAVIGVRMDWAYPPYIDQHWGAEVQRLQSSPPGTLVVIPINPKGWTVSLVARR